MLLQVAAANGIEFAQWLKAFHLAKHILENGTAAASATGDVKDFQSSGHVLFLARKLRARMFLNRPC